MCGFQDSSRRICLQKGVVVWDIMYGHSVDISEKSNGIRMICDIRSMQTYHGTLRHVVPKVTRSLGRSKEKDLPREKRQTGAKSVVAASKEVSPVMYKWDSKGQRSKHRQDGGEGRPNCALAIFSHTYNTLLQYEPPECYLTDIIHTEYLDATVILENKKNSVLF